VANSNRPQQTFMAACVEFFGVKEGQTKLAFGKEVQALTPDDRAEITKMLIEQEGYNIIGS
jgi:hypothetical protein